MTDKQYIDFHEYDPDKVAELLKSSKTDDKVNGLLNTVLSSGDYEKSNDFISRFLDADEISLKQTVILCIGHLGRIYGRINLDEYIPVLENIIKNQDGSLVDYAEDALNDIWIFCDKEKVMSIDNDTYVGKYFTILRISDSSEREGNYDKGIMKIKELSITELNPSLQRIQRASLQYLNNLREAPSSPQQHL